MTPPCRTFVFVVVLRHLAKTAGLPLHIHSLISNPFSRRHRYPSNSLTTTPAVRAPNSHSNKKSVQLLSFYLGTGSYRNLVLICNLYLLNSSFDFVSVIAEIDFRITRRQRRRLVHLTEWQHNRQNPPPLLARHPLPKPPKCTEDPGLVSWAVDVLV